MKVVSSAVDLKGNLLRDVWLDSDGDVVYWDAREDSWVYLTSLGGGGGVTACGINSLEFPLFRLVKGYR